jgi:hypothetical protein
MPAPVVAIIAAAETASTIVIFFNTDFSSIFQVYFLFARLKWTRAAQSHRRRALPLLARVFSARSGFAGVTGEPADRPRAEDDPAAVSAPKFCAKRSWDLAR